MKRAILLFMGAAILAYVAYLVREIWLPFTVALLIAVVLDPLVDRMERRGLSRLLSAIVIYLVFFVAVAAVLTYLVPAIVTQAIHLSNTFGQYVPSSSDTQTRRSLDRLMHHLHASNYVQHRVLQASASVSELFSEGSAYLGRLAQSWVGNILWVVVVPIVAFYALKDFHVIYARLLLLVPHDRRAFTQHMFNEITAIFVGYVRGLATVCALNGCATALVLWLVFRLPGAIALGAIAGLLYMVPYFGPVVITLLITGDALTSGSVERALIVAGSMILLHSVIFDQMVTPRVVGRHVGLHPILAIMALLAGGYLLGIIGMLLAVPFAATLQMVLQVIVPKLAQPIDVPTGEELHARVERIERGKPVRAVTEEEKEIDVHDTIIEAVDSADASHHAPGGSIQAVEQAAPDANSGAGVAFAGPTGAPGDSLADPLEGRQRGAPRGPSATSQKDGPAEHARRA